MSPFRIRHAMNSASDLTRREPGCGNPQWVAGVDEAGRGPLAGPVFAAAVVFERAPPIEGIADSKALSEDRREILSKQIQAQAVCWALGRAEVDEIDTLNILQASLLAMKRAVSALKHSPGLVMVDGNRPPMLDQPVCVVVHGDAIVPVISAASILAKVARDAYMKALEKRFPGYGFARHKGYPTKAHLDAIKRLGACPAHRRSFKPVKCLMANAP